MSYAYGEPNAEQEIALLQERIDDAVERWWSDKEVEDKEEYLEQTGAQVLDQLRWEEIVQFWIDETVDSGEAF